MCALFIRHYSSFYSIPSSKQVYVVPTALQQLSHTGSSQLTTKTSEPRCEKKKRFSGFPTRSHTSQAAQPHKMARGLKFRIWEVEGLYYLCSENKGADQLRGYREADLRLCFRICRKPVFSRRGSSHLISGNRHIGKRDRQKAPTHLKQLHL